MEKQQTLLETYPEIETLTADGFDGAIIGICERSERVIYSVNKCMLILMSQGMTDEEAQEFFSYNVEGAYMGEKTPIWCNDIMFYDRNEMAHKWK